jgi:FkbM family methyltransferase
MLRHRSKRAVARSPAGPALRRTYRAVFRPAVARRERRDNDALRVVLAATLAPDGSAIDIGAHRGEVLRDMVRLAPLGRHIAFEPLPDLHAELTRMFPGVDVRDAALSDEPGQTRFVHVRTSPAYSGLRERAYPGEEELEEIDVRVETLDAALPEGFVPALVKIDVEGAELQVLRGGLDTLARHKPLVVFEHGKGASPAYGTRPADVFELLTAQVALRVFDMDGEGPYSLAQFEEAYEQGSRWNFLARP